ncbi:MULTISPECIES: TrmH family RNA methyltransferase [unclassified Sphingomonas]|uniref:TrmH family RNA methyltransferase n=1 Tax=unclassified Sphingomonas TaxID=196159 RepID=UPI000E756ABA|nr:MULTISPECIES: TrmH family RNA methyltransferase [unclassified Sphingomonas]RKE43711.1 tRNA/rRNA methyltransferase [Sphingomonas sp. PP-CC-1A-547]TCM05938.1 tRNA/rRNA methyltransferase [Sphingomonas sp. PP-CC-3G-468]
MSFYAYMLRCSDGSYYIGHTDSIERRIAQHQHGELPGYTHKRRPVTLMWSQDFPSRIEALEAERQLKGWTRVKKEALAAGDWDAVRLLSRKSFDTGLRLRSAPTQDERGWVDERDGLDVHDGLAEPDDFGELGEIGGFGDVIDENMIGTDAAGDSDVLADGDGAVGAPPPVIVLVRPQLGENIGKAARAMLNFGLVEMRLVSPRDGWPNPSAGPAASGADIVLQNAKVYESVAAATADCAQVFATTVRKRGVTKPVVTPEQASTEIHAAPGRSAILFGPERSGLETDDVAVARTIITVPINPEFGSLNLAQAVILVAYEWSKGLTAERGLSQPSINPIMPPAPQEELDGMIGQLDAMLMGAGFFHLPDKMQSTRRTLRTLLTKPGWSSQEVRTMRGVLSSLAGKRPRG